jgi:signal peptidase II
MAQEMLLAAIFVFMADQATKRLVASRFAPGEAVAVVRCVELCYLKNRFDRQCSPRDRVALSAAWLLLIGALFWFTQTGFIFRHPIAQIGIGAAIGGSGSNLYERFRHGTVIDFVKIGWWPVFNLADVAITFGVIAALCFIR